MIAFGTEHNNLRHAPFLIKAEESEENCIRFVIALAREGEKGADSDDMGIEALGEILRGAAPVVPDEAELYEITFEQYILHQTRNESYCSIDSYEKKQGDFFVVFEASRLLDALPVMTDCQRLADGVWYPGRWKHYGIYCQNHIIDVISHHEPVVKRLRPVGRE